VSKVLRCYAEGHGGEWEAICIDLDIAVQGASFEGVFESLNTAIALYLETVEALPADERARLVERPVPLGVKLKLLQRALSVLFRDHSNDESYSHQYTVSRAA